MRTRGVRVTVNEKRETEGEEEGRTEVMGGGEGRKGVTTARNKGRG